MLENAVVEDACSVEDAKQGRRGREASGWVEVGGEQGLEGLLIRDVELGDRDLDSLSLEMIEFGLGCGGGFAASDQEEGGCTAIDEPLGNVQSECAEAACNQISAAGFDGERL